MLYNMLLSQEKKKWFDVLILNKPESVVIRMRDNGSAFDPSDYLNMAKDVDGKETFGIKMISSLADKFDYSRNMGLNVLIIALKSIAKLTFDFEKKDIDFEYIKNGGNVDSTAFPPPVLQIRVLFADKIQ